MADEQEKKAKKPAIGSISQFATLGRKRHDVLTAKEDEELTETSHDDLQSEGQSGMTALSQDALQSKGQDRETASDHEVREAKEVDRKNFTSQPVKEGVEQEGMTAMRQPVKKPKIPPHMKQQTIYMPKTLAHRLKIHAAIIEEDISDIVAKLIEAYLDKEEHPPD